MRAASQKVKSVLVIDVGGTHVKVTAPGQREERRIPSGSKDDRGQNGTGCQAPRQGLAV